VLVLLLPPFAGLYPLKENSIKFDAPEEAEGVPI